MGPIHERLSALCIPVDGDEAARIKTSEITRQGEWETREHQSTVPATQRLITRCLLTAVEDPQAGSVLVDA
ncbi:hypothetical protein HY439_00455 [Candidatus Microgenomates bacterium]|nr:hypothetical protein [Candidatus Microgenomates bacterium]